MAGGTGGRTGAGGAVGTGGSAAGTGGGAAICAVSIGVVSSSPGEEIRAGQRSKVLVRGTLAGVFPAPAATSFRWTWTVVFYAPGSGGVAVTPQVKDGDRTTVEFPVALSGTYVVHVALQRLTAGDGGGGAGGGGGGRGGGGAGGRGGASDPAIASPSCRDGDLTVIARDPPPAALLFRATPPPDSRSPAGQETTVRLSSGVTALSTVRLNLVAGQPVTFDPHEPGASGQPITYLPSYLRVSIANSSWRIEAHSARGPVTVPLLPARGYEVLMIPEGDVAPKSAVIVPGAVDPSAFVLDAGIAVSGTILGPESAPVGGARVVLWAGPRPSTVGVSDAAGRFTVRTRAGGHVMSVAPPAGAGWPDGFAEDPMQPGQAVLVEPAGAPVLTFRFAAAASARLQVTVRDPAGGVVAGARVRGRLTGKPTAGTLTAAPWGGGAPLSVLATGSSRFEGVTDAAGALVLTGVPIGRYRVTAVAPAATGAGMTAAPPSAAFVGELDLAGDRAWTVDLPPPARWTGTLGPVPGVAGARVVAIATADDGLPAAAAAVVDASGAFTLSVDPGQSYRLTAEPAAGALLARTPLGTWTAPATATGTLGAFTLPRGVRVDGLVTSAAGSPAPGVFIETLCNGGSGDTCPDPGFSYAETTTAADGSFRVVVPESIVPR